MANNEICQTILDTINKFIFIDINNFDQPKENDESKDKCKKFKKQSQR